MNYIDKNKEAWQEAFGVHQKAWKENPVEKHLLKGEWLLTNVVIRELERLEFKGKIIGQLCCNNGRELLSALKMGAQFGYGFVSRVLQSTAGETA